MKDRRLRPNSTWDCRSHEYKPDPGWRSPMAISEQSAERNVPAVKAENSAGGVGVSGVSADGRGVEGRSGKGVGVVGISADYRGVEGRSTNEHGIFGQSTKGAGVAGVSENYRGVVGRSTNEHGVFGESVKGAGVVGVSSGYRGVSGRSDSGQGVWGTSETSAGVLGTSTTGVGVLGKGPVAGLFEGDVVVTGDLSSRGVSIGQLLERAERLEDAVRILQSKVPGSTGTQPITSTPTIQVVAEGSSPSVTFAVTGTGFTPGTKAYIRVADDEMHPHVIRETAVLSNGEIGDRIVIPTVPGRRLHFSVTDGTAVISNTFTVTSP